MSSNPPSTTLLQENPFQWTRGCPQPASRSHAAGGAEDVAAATAAAAAEDEAGKLKEEKKM